MTKAIAVLVIVAILYGGWHLFLYWDKVKNEEDLKQKQAAASAIVPQQLPGLPYSLETSLDAAYRNGTEGLEKWLKAYGPMIQDPRKGWIELDYVLLISRQNPAEAKRIFAAVKQRTPQSSPLMGRIKQLEKTYD